MTMLNRRAALAALAGALIATGAAAQTKTVSMELKKVFPYLDAYYRLPAAERNRFTMAYYLSLPAGASMTIGGERIAVGPHGRILRLPTAQMLASKQTATFQAREGTKYSINRALEPTSPPAARMSAAELVAAIDQANRGIKKAAPAPMRMVIPKMASVRFLDAGSGEVLMAGGRRAPLPVVEGQPRFEPAAWAGAETIVLAKVPSRVQIGSASKPKKK